MLLFMLMATACSAPRTPPVVHGPAPTTESGPILALGDWDDLPAAISAAASRHELAPTTSISPEKGVARFELVTVHGEPVHVSARSLSPGPGEEPRIELSGSWGRFPEHSDARGRLQRLLESIADRLGQLRGVDAAPIRWTSRGP